MAFIHEVRKTLKKCGVTDIKLKHSYVSKKEDRYAFDSAIRIEGIAETIKEAIEILKRYGFDSEYYCMGYAPDGTEFGSGTVRIVD